MQVHLDKGVVEEFRFKETDADLTVGWLLSEVTRRYDRLFNKGIHWDKEMFKSKKIINGLKTMEGILSLDYYLTDLDNSLARIKASTMLTVHYVSQKDIATEEKVGKNSFQYLKVIG